MSQIKRYRNMVYDLRWSPEIEASFPEKADVNSFDERYRKFFKDWTVTTDVSIEPHGLEFKPKDTKHLFYNKQTFEDLKDVLVVIKSRQGRVNSTTGCHLHVDASKFNSENILKIVKEIVVRGKYICDDLKVNSDRLSDTCQLIRKKDVRNLSVKLIDDLKNNKEDTDIICPILENKYYILNLLNLSRYGTLEFRLFNGTLSIREIKRNLKFLFEFLINALERE